MVQSGSLLYGTSDSGGSNGEGTIFQYNLTTNTESVLYSFAGGTGDSANPIGSLLPSGSIYYGIGGSGGTAGDGTIYTFNPTTNKESILYSFPGNASHGEFPTGSLIQSGNNLYGITAEGGTHNDGTIFSYNLTNNNESVLYSFTGSTNGALPTGTLILSGSTLYGWTSSLGSAGGTDTGGTIFSYNLSTTKETTLHSFTGAPGDGAFPYGSMILSGSTLYGLTSEGGAGPAPGAIIDYNLDTNTEGLLYSFKGGGSDGAQPTWTSPRLVGAPKGQIMTVQGACHGQAEVQPGVQAVGGEAGQ